MANLLHQSELEIIRMSLSPDVIDLDEYYHYKQREGAFNGIIMFLHKVSIGIAVGLVGLLIKLFGYTEALLGQSVADSVQPDSALTAIRIILAILPSLAFFITIIFTWRLDMTRERFDTIIQALDKRKN